MRTVAEFCWIQMGAHHYFVSDGPRCGAAICSFFKGKSSLCVRCSGFTCTRWSPFRVCFLKVLFQSTRSKPTWGQVTHKHATNCMAPKVLTILYVFCTVTQCRSRSKMPPSCELSSAVRRATACLVCRSFIGWGEPTRLRTCTSALFFAASPFLVVYHN